MPSVSKKTPKKRVTSRSPQRDQIDLKYISELKHMNKKALPIAWKSYNEKEEEKMDSIMELISIYKTLDDVDAKFNGRDNYYTR